MSEENKLLNPENIAAKRAAVKQGQGKNTKLAVAALAIIALIGLTATLSVDLLPGKPEGSSEGAMFGNAPVAGRISHPLSDFVGRAPRFYTYDADPVTTVRYFIGIDDGKLASAGLDACADCWRGGEGHRVEDGRIVCNTCAKSFPLEGFAEVRDPCAPFPLKASVRDGAVHLDVADLRSKIKYFKTSKGGI